MHALGSALCWVACSWCLTIVGVSGRLGCFCAGYGGHVFTALVDEFGSLFDSAVEQQCFHDIVMYMTKQGGAAAYSHQPVQSWFYW